MAALASRLKASRTQQAEGVDAARTQPAGRGTDQKRVVRRLRERDERQQRSSPPPFAEAVAFLY